MANVEEEEERQLIEKRRLALLKVTELQPCRIEHALESCTSYALSFDACACCTRLVSPFPASMCQCIADIQDSAGNECSPKQRTLHTLPERSVCAISTRRMNCRVDLTPSTMTRRGVLADLTQA